MKNKSFRNYLRRSLVLYTAALILLIYLLYGGFMALSLRLSTMRVNAQVNAELSADVARWQSGLRQTLGELCDSPEIRLALEARGTKQLTVANSLLYSKTNALPVGCIFVLLDHDWQIVSTNLNFDNRAVFLSSTVARSARDALSRQPDRIYEAPSRINYAYDQQTDWFFAATVPGAQTPAGAICIDVTDAGLREALRGRQADMTVLADRFDNVLYTDGTQAVGVIGKLSVRVDGGGFVTLDGRDYFVSVSQLEQEGVRVLTFSSTVLHQQMLRFGMLLISLLAVVVLCFAPLLANWLTRHNLRPVETMIQTVRHQDLSSRIHQRTFVEFQALFDEFNAMMERVQTLIRHNEELSERKRMMEVRHLKEQFNPHFVFNVMENLHFVLLSDPQKAADMLVAFGSLMRYEIDETKALVPLETDMEYVNDYLLLQKTRYGKRLEYHIDISDSLMGCMIPKLLVQPIVENSIKHGMPPEETLTITITARLQERFLTVRIADDGEGMPPDQLSALKGMLDREDAATTHIGLYNTHRALLLMYGPPCGLKLQSAAGRGMAVELTVPEVRENA